MSTPYDKIFDPKGKGVPDGEFSAEDFCQLIENKNSVCFFLGAGFSKSWNNKYPSGNNLFAISKEQSENLNYTFISLAESLGLEWLSESDGFSQDDMADVFRELKYQIDIYKRYPSLLPSYLDEFSISRIEKQFSLFVRKRIENLLKNKNELNLTFDSKKLTKDQTAIFNFFKRLNPSSAPTFITTNYDFVIDRLLINSDLSQHPIRGVISENSFNDIKWKPGSNDCQLLKINGGLEIFENSEFGFIADYSKAEEGVLPPKLIVPSREQNYSDSYFRSVFLNSCAKLRDANYLVFIGYSLPEDDYILRFLLSKFTDTVEGKLKTIYIIDYSKDIAVEIAERAAKIFPKLADQNAIKFYSGSFQSLCKKLESVDLGL